MTSNNIPTLLVMAGGTGGHIFPGLAVADHLKAQGWQIHWLGTAERMEARLVPEYGYDISYINISGMRNKGLVSLLSMPFKLISSLYQGIRVINAVKPDVVLGMGGYASGPGGFAAWLLRKPLIVHEQNAAAGLTNRLLSKIASKVCCAFPNAFTSEINAEVVGNPLRASIGKNSTGTISVSENDISKQDSPLRTKGQRITPVNNNNNNGESVNHSRNILVVGGSLGAQVLNQVVPSAFAQLSTELNSANSNDQALPFHIWHQTGKDKHEQVIEQYNNQLLASGQVTVSEFITDIASAYQWADVVICRAGALTVSELAMAATPAIFVPLPHAVDDHQTKNANFLVSQGGAILIKQSELTPANLSKQLKTLFSEKQILNNMSQAALQAADSNATAKVAQLCQQLVPVN